MPAICSFTRTASSLAAAAARSITLSLQSATARMASTTSRSAIPGVHLGERMATFVWLRAAPALRALPACCSIILWCPHYHRAQRHPQHQRHRRSQCRHRRRCLRQRRSPHRYQLQNQRRRQRLHRFTACITITHRASQMRSRSPLMVSRAPLAPLRAIAPRQTLAQRITRLVTAAPKCSLKDPDDGVYRCALRCSSSSECDSANGAFCGFTRGYGYCMYPPSDATSQPVMAEPITVPISV